MLSAHPASAATAPQYQQPALPQLPLQWPPHDAQGTRKLHPASSFAISSIAPALAVLFTNPFDTAKVRLQLQGERLKLASAGTAPPPAVLYANSFDCMRKTLANEGIRGLQKGLSPAILREASKNLFRLGMYDHILGLLHPPGPAAGKEKSAHGQPPPWKLMTAGAICGAMGALACNPFELVKTRLQSSATGALSAVGHQHGYTGIWMGLRSIVKSDGLAGLYRGSGMSVARSIVGSGSNLAAFHVCKAWLMDSVEHGGCGWGDTVGTDMFAGMASGLASVICMNPVDVLRTRYYNQPYVNGKGQLYSSGIDLFHKVIKNEGWSALYKGFSSHFLRIGPHFCLTFMFLGVLRRGLISAHEYQDARTVFKALDADRDGILNRAEVGAAVKVAGLGAGVSEAVWSRYAAAPPASATGVPFAQFRELTWELRKEARAQALRSMYATRFAKKDADPVEVLSHFISVPVAQGGQPSSAQVEQRRAIAHIMLDFASPPSSSSSLAPALSSDSFVSSLLPVVESMGALPASEDDRWTAVVKAWQRKAVAIAESSASL
ncbi:mitochondrial carrier domain-containing protein [Catenaria anguillulae PL171]|uniref:Mitochondrial carrier domain-containing protein n=1 Tax=Catenaria anguillulae PL171 TaxID=765915 RepID=A0A1Y2HL36_9FUNG|nr:mitochondrial carrier domain-containing protein [Catenaria anguillulae PL171]